MRGAAGPPYQGPLGRCARAHSSDSRLHSKQQHTHVLSLNPTPDLFPRDAEDGQPQLAAAGTGAGAAAGAASGSRAGKGRGGVSRDEIVRFADAGYVLAGVARTAEAGTVMSKPPDGDIESSE